jgi:hypothetical protein
MLRRRLSIRASSNQLHPSASNMSLKAVILRHRCRDVTVQGLKDQHTGARVSCNAACRTGSRHQRVADRQRGLTVIRVGNSRRQFSQHLARAYAICSRLSDQGVEENGNAQGQEHRRHQIGTHARRIRINNGHRVATGMRSTAIDDGSRGPMRPRTLSSGIGTSCGTPGRTTYAYDETRPVPNLNGRSRSKVRRRRCWHILIYLGDEVVRSDDVRTGQTNRCDRSAQDSPMALRYRKIIIPSTECTTDDGLAFWPYGPAPADRSQGATDPSAPTLRSAAWPAAGALEASGRPSPVVRRSRNGAFV